MAILQISRIQHRRGLQQDLPQLASAELGWSIDSRKLFIGNGTVDEGAPEQGVTEILTEYSILDFTVGFAANVTALETNVTDIDSRVSALEAGSVLANPIAITGPGTGTITTFTSNNAFISYTLTQGIKQRSGTIKASRYDSTSSVSYDDEYTETATTDINLSVTANASHMSLNYSTISSTSFLYQINYLH